jgi:hypothetical protein
MGSRISEEALQVHKLMRMLDSNCDVTCDVGSSIPEHLESLSALDVHALTMAREWKPTYPRINPYTEVKAEHS